MSRARLLLWPGGAALGIVAESHLYGWGDTRHWVPDGAVGWVMIGCGLIAWGRRSDSRAGPLLVAAGAAWFAGNLWSQALYLHRGPLVHLALTYPSGRIRGRTRGTAIIAGWVAAVVPSVWGSAVLSVALAGLLLAVAIHACAVATRPQRLAAFASLAVAGWLSALVAATAAVRLASVTDAAAGATLAAYQAGLVMLALGVTAALIAGAYRRAVLTDLVVELGDGDAGSLRDALARALGDPTLEIAFRARGAAGYVDAGGRPLQLPGEGSLRRVTHLERDREVDIALIHDEGTLDDPGLLDAIDAAARLTAANAWLHAEVRRQVDEVDASRRRLLRAGDEQRRRLEDGLREGAVRRLDKIGPLLAGAGNGSLSPGTARQLERAELQLADTLADLHELGAGLHPRVLNEHGLAKALAALAARSPVQMACAAPEQRFSSDVEAAAYFVCSEALANVAKHASATHVSIQVRASRDSLIAEVTDDGCGGAVTDGGGTGLRGLADRVDAMGGSLEVRSPRGGGTRVTATLPLSPGHG